jgi:hypothetical protein
MQALLQGASEEREMMTITLTREEAQQVLDALEDAADHIGCPDDDDAIGIARKALRARLAQPEQRTGDCLLTGVCAAEGHRIQKAQREWQGLEIDEVKATAELGIYEKPLIDFARAIEAKLKAKNAP